MKLYSRRHLIFTAAATGIAVSLIAAAVAFAVHRAESGSRLAQEVPGVPEELGVPEKLDVPEADDGLSLLQTNTPSLTVSTDTASFSQDELQNISVYERCNEAVVNITTQVMGYDWFLEPVVTSSGSGSGSIIDKRGYVVTNVHVIENATTITISLSDGSAFEGRVIGKDEESDIAVLKFDPPAGRELKTISFGNADNLKVGQKVIAIGNPFGLERTMTAGIISGLGRPIQESSSVIIRNMIQTDAAINPGNSGGPLLDSQGRMIGINTIIYSSSGSSSGVGFAIPVSTARRVVSDLLQYGKVNRGIMRLSLVQNSGRIASYAGYRISTGMIVSSVAEGSLAESGGLKGGTTAVRYGSTRNAQTIYLGGDIIVGIDGIEVSTLADYYSALEDKKPGDAVAVSVYRNGRTQTLRITLEAERN